MKEFGRKEMTLQKFDSTVKVKSAFPGMHHFGGSNRLRSNATFEPLHQLATIALAVAANILLFVMKRYHALYVSRLAQAN